MVWRFCDYPVDENGILNSSYRLLSSEPSSLTGSRSSSPCGLDMGPVSQRTLQDIFLELEHLDKLEVIDKGQGETNATILALSARVAAMETNLEPLKNLSALADRVSGT